MKFLLCGKETLTNHFFNDALAFQPFHLLAPPT